MKLSSILLLMLVACGGEPPPQTPPVVMAPAPSPGEAAAGPPSAPSRAVPTLPRGRRLAVQDDEICVVHRGALYCRKEPNVSPKPPPAPPLFSLESRLHVPGQVIDVATARYHGCAVNDEGKVFCWGSNEAGTRGDGGPKDRAFPAEVPGLEGVVRVVVAFRHSCAQTASGEVYCWGDNWQGEVGHDTAYRDAAIDLVRPVKVAGIAGIEAIWAGESLSCARSTSREVRCWGDAIGLGVEGPTPTPVEHLADASTLAFGNQSYWCRILDEAQPVACRGQQYSAWTGLLPHRDATYPGTEGAVELALGNEHACARTAAGKVICWGKPTGGALGRVVDQPGMAEPQPVAGIDDAQAIATSDYQTCALGRQTLYCWGRYPWREDRDNARDARLRRTRLPR